MVLRATPGSSSPPDRQALAEACRHPLKGMILMVLSERSHLTIREVSERLGESPRRVRHHVEVLVGAGLVEVAGEETRAGVIQRRYKVGPSLSEGLDSLSVDARVEMVRATARLLIADIRAARAARTFARRKDDFEIRMYGEVDDTSLEQLADIHRRAYREIRQAIEEGRKRLRETGEAGTEVVSALFFFESPLWGSRVSGRPDRNAARTVSRRYAANGSASPSVESCGSLDPRALAAATDHPVRARVIAALAERPGITIRELAERVGEPRRRVRHHVEALVGAGLAMVTGEERCSGVVRRRYGAGPLAVEDPDCSDVEARMVVAKWVVRLLLFDMGAAAAAGTLAARPNDLEMRMYGEVDDSSLRHLADIHRRAYREIRPAVEEGRERLRRRGEAGTEIVSALFFFEAPVWGRRPASMDAAPGPTAS